MKRIVPFALLVPLLAAGCVATTPATTPAAGPSLSLNQARACGALGQIAGVIVDGRRAGLTRAQQKAGVERGTMIGRIQTVLIDNVYNSPRPRNEGEWTALRFVADNHTTETCMTHNT